MKSVKLRIIATGEERTFEPVHAERILRYPKSGWELAETKIELTENGFKPIRNKKADSISE